ncbi:MAG: lamin tail domain-containing protein [Candidatus Cloacimonetes bacterium]|nr:lamin tail domain-containing protein [Candidatus Cloacimonadota bacterium]MBS3767703.1 lamin tail domain-containing protein [Candidatus Cloacimonadota bacterium]
MKRDILLAIGFFYCLTVAHSQPIKLNEIYYDHPGADGGYEWIELYNPGTEIMNLHNWTLEKAGTEFTEFFSFPQISLPPDSFLLIGEEYVTNADIITDIALQNGGSATDGVRLISSDSDTIDTILYDSPNTNQLPGDEFQAGINFAPDVEAGNSLCRYPDGNDSNNCAIDCFSTSFPTPGAANKIFIDLEAESVEIMPENPDSTQEINLVIKVRNNSGISLSANNWNYEIYINQTLWDVFSPDDTIPPDTCLTLEHNIGSFNSGYFQILVELTFDDDELWNNSKSTSFLIPPTPLIINEFMYKPGSDNAEWVEIFNRSQNEFPLYHWKIKDNGSSWNNISSSYTIKPGDYLIVTQDTLAVSEFYYSNLIILQTDDWSNLNNSSADQVILADSNKTVIDSINYNPNDINCDKDMSLERKNPFSEIAENWDVSTDSSGASPGTKNSITPLDYDICSQEISVWAADDYINLIATAKNIGFNTMQDIDLILFDDKNLDNNFQVEEELYMQTISLQSEEEKTIEYQTEAMPGYHKFGILVSAAQDMQPENNIDFTTYNSKNSYPISVNEIMPAPASPEPEWLELYNNLDYTLSPTDWKICDLTDTLSISFVRTNLSSAAYLLILPELSDSTYIIEKYYNNLNPGDVCFAEGLPALNNSYDKLVIMDEYGSILDSLLYYSDWGEEENNSLERINPDIDSNISSNWESSVHKMGATPGKENSLFINNISPNVSLSVTPNPVSLAKKKSVLIEYNLPEVISLINIRIFDVKGRLVRKLVDQDWVGAEGAITWDCKNSKNNVMPLGIYIIHMEAAGKESNNIYQKTISMVIGEK